MEDNRFPGFPVLKGLQQPLEFMGIQGRYIYWAAAAVGGAIVGFIIAYCIAGFVAGLVVLLLALGVGAAFVFTRQRKGLHTKREDSGVFIDTCSKRL